MVFDQWHASSAMGPVCGCDISTYCNISPHASPTLQLDLASIWTIAQQDRETLDPWFVVFLSVKPFALIMRLLGKDPLRLIFDAKAESYWIRREPLDPTGDSMRRQF